MSEQAPASDFTEQLDRHLPWPASPIAGSDAPVCEHCGGHCQTGPGPITFVPVKTYVVSSTAELMALLEDLLGPGGAL